METLEKAPPQPDVAAEDADFTRETIARPAGWSPLTRLGFRMAFIYFCGFMWLYGNGTIFNTGVVVGGWISTIATLPMNHLAMWSGRHIFHLADVPADWRVTHRGDTMINWVLDQVFIVGSLVGGLVWTAIARLRRSSRTEYRTLLVWLRFFLRLSVAFFMVGYGTLKLFPLQMVPISIATLNEPIGQASGMTLLWSVIALHPLYESIMGLAEVLAGALLLFRRTALVGALFSVFVLSNVVIYNFFFDVSVKLFALNLLLAASFLVLPDVKRLIDFFWLHKIAAQTSIWAPPTHRRGVKIYVRTLEISFIAALLVIIPAYNGIIWQHERKVARVQSPLLGAWHVDSTHPAAGPFVTPNGPVTDLYVDTVDRAFRRSADGSLWRTYLWTNAYAQTLFMNPFDSSGVTFSWKMPDPNHLILISRPSYQKATHNLTRPPTSAPTIVALTRTPIPKHYPLFDPSFHFVMQGSRER